MKCLPQIQTWAGNGTMWFGADGYVWTAGGGGASVDLEDNNTVLSSYRAAVIGTRGK